MFQGGDGYWIRYTPRVWDEFVVIGTHTHKAFLSLPDLQPIEVTRKNSIDSGSTGSNSQRDDKYYLVLVNGKKKKKKK